MEIIVVLGLYGCHRFKKTCMNSGPVKTSGPGIGGVPGHDPESRNQTVVEGETLRKLHSGKPLLRFAQGHRLQLKVTGVYQIIAWHVTPN